MGKEASFEEGQDRKNEGWERIEEEGRGRERLKEGKKEGEEETF